MCRPNEYCRLCAAEKQRLVVVTLAAEDLDEGSQTGCASLFLVALWVAAVTVCSWMAGL